MTDAKKKALDQKPSAKVVETPQPKEKANSKAGGDDSRPAPKGVGAKEAGAVSLKKPKAQSSIQNQRSTPSGESLAKPKAQPTPAAPVR